MKRAVVFAHYDPKGRIEDYVVDYLAALRDVSDQIVFVSTADLSAAEKDKICAICSSIVSRQNEGYDFGSWSVGIRLLGRAVIEKLDELVLCNDSCYASPHALRQMVAAMEQRDADFWGVTESFDYKYHIHSYFLAFRSPVLRSKVFWTFYESVSAGLNKIDVVKRYEVGLTHALLRGGFRCDAYIRYSRIQLFVLACGAKVNVLAHSINRGGNGAQQTSPAALLKRRSLRKWIDILWIFLNPLNVNTTLYDWRRLILKGSPFLKSTVARLNVYHDVHIGDWRTLAHAHGFSVEKIQRHLDASTSIRSIHNPADPERSGRGCAE